MGMLHAETPAASLPKGTFFDHMTRVILIALETIRERDFSSPTSFAKYYAAFLAVFSFFNIRWTLGGEDMWDLIIMGWKKKSRGGRGASGKKMLLEVGTNHARGEVLFDGE